MTSPSLLRGSLRPSHHGSLHRALHPGLRVGALAALALAVSSAATVRTADACSPRAPFLEPIRPRLGELDVATNAKIWIASPEVETVTLRGNNEVIEADVVQVANLAAYVATPRSPLLPGITYTVSATSPQTTTPQNWHFTTGSGPTQVRPATPAELRVSAVLSKEPIGSCDPPAGTFIVSVAGAPVSGAVIYQLEVLSDEGFEPVALGVQPSFTQQAGKLPTPTYRIRPIAGNGATGEEQELPAGNATEPKDDDDEDGGGCAAAGGGSGAALSALLLLTLASRRRRPAVSAHPSL